MPNRRREVKDVELYACLKCGKAKKKADFYKSNREENVSGIIPYCKECSRKMCSDEKGRVIQQNLINFLKDPNVDKPFVEEIFNISVADKSETLGVYMRNLSRSKYRNLRWSDGETNFYGGGLVMQDITDEEDGFEVTTEIMELFGEGYSEKEYKLMLQKYNKLSPFYPQPTPLHTEALMNYIRNKSKEEIAIVENRMTDAKFWGDLARQAARDANINPAQLKAQDTKDGLNSFSKIYEEVERAVDIVPILPKFKNKPMDSADFIIYVYSLYVRDLLGMPPCEYSEIYEFYDKAVQAHIDKYGDEEGLFTNEPTVKNRPRIRQFLDDCREKVN